MKKLIVIPTVGLFILASLYLAAGLFGDLGQIQIVRMLELQDSAEGSAIHVLYTAILFIAAFFGFLAFRRKTVAVNGLCIFLGLAIASFTTVCIAIGTTGSRSASYYENYIGEGVTVIAGLLLLASVLIPEQPSGATQ